MTEDELILTHILQISRSELYLQKPILTKNQKQEFESIKLRRKQGEPLQYLLGTANFMGFDFKVDRRVLIPRPETEVLVDEAINRFNGSQILDIGTGSGNIAITLAKHFPQGHVTSVDVSKEALDLAQENARIHGVSNITFVQADITQFKTEKRFDMVISNPPYIPRADLAALPLDVRQEPVSALDGGEDGLDFYRVIIKMIPLLIREGAYLMMEYGDGQETAIYALLSKPQIFSNIQILKDLTGKNRFICAQ